MINGYYKLRKDLINAIVSEFSEVEPNTNI